jgi:uncharacterized 2Fe-2S/4Fe-4S cluster protein (DUF4445 family)
MPTIHFLPFQKTIAADGHRTLLELARELGLPLRPSCGGKKICGRCRIIIEESQGPLVPPTEREREALGELVDKGYRLACETVLSGEARVRIPEESQTRPPVILTADGFGEFPVRLAPAVESYFLEVPSPVLERVTADRERLLRALEAGYGLKKVTVDSMVLPQLPHILRAREHQVTAAVRNGREVVGVFPGREERLLGLAVDIGTTTVVAYLLDLQTGERLAVASALNPQVHFGDDVITRLAFSQKDPEGSVQLREAVKEGINDLIGRVAEKAGVRPELIVEAAVVGNTAMHHLFLGLETQYLGRAPYPPAVQGSVFAKARDVGLAINPSGTVHLLPLKAGFVGSDIIAGILATGLHKSSRVRLLIDLGTNGEMVLGNRDRMLCCSTAAGPAFEGGHIRWGMRASSGAIDRVQIDPNSLEISLRTIQDQPALGLCGSGILSVVAEMIRRGILLAKGTFNPAINSPRLREGKEGRGWVLLWKWESLSDQEIAFTRKDVAEVQMAKAAIQAGIELLKELFGNQPIGEILLAGAFGNYADPSDVRTLGIISASLEPKVRGVGNAAGYGACLTLLDKIRAKEADRIARKLEYVELAGNSRFQELLVDSLLFQGARDFKDFV